MIEKIRQLIYGGDDVAARISRLETECIERIRQLENDLVSANENAKANARRIGIFQAAYPELWELYFTKKGEEKRMKAEEFKKKSALHPSRYRRPSSTTKPA